MREDMFGQNMKPFFNLSSWQPRHKRAAKPIFCLADGPSGVCLAYCTAASCWPVCALGFHCAPSFHLWLEIIQSSAAVLTCRCPTDMWYLPPLVCLVFLALIPLWAVVARQNPQTREVLRSGWQPVIVAMSISRYVLWEASEKHLCPRWAAPVRINVSLIASLCDFQHRRPYSGQDGERSQLQGHGCVHARHQR